MMMYLLGLVRHWAAVMTHSLVRLLLVQGVWKELAGLANFYNCARLRAECDQQMVQLSKTKKTTVDGGVWNDLIFAYKTQLPLTEAQVLESVCLNFRAARLPLTDKQWEDIVGQLPKRILCKLIDGVQFSLHGWEPTIENEIKARDEEKQQIQLFRYGQDAPRDLIGVRIEFEYNPNGWYWATIANYNANTDEHTVEFDDRDVHCYQLRNCNWRIEGSKFAWRGVT
jgi:hypothetical protein